MNLQLSIEPAALRATNKKTRSATTLMVFLFGILASGEHTKIKNLFLGAIMEAPVEKTIRFYRRQVRSGFFWGAFSA